MPEKVIVGMSGGVDSALSALLLLQQGFTVEGLFMKNWEDDDDASYCAAAEDLAIAERVCGQLGIELHKVNFAAEYWQRVFRHFLDEYAAGRTPNPDILCNKEIKFKAFPQYAARFHADYTATGHYARTQLRDGYTRLLRGLDPNKDQSYFLHSLDQSQLHRHRFPVGDLHKTEVRRRAYAEGLANHDRKDSTGICFIGERRFRDFLQRYLPATPGLIRTAQGEVVGEHRGVFHYTLGQRQGLGIGGRKNAEEGAWFVAGKNVETNTLIVVQGHEHPLLYSRSIMAQPVHWIAPPLPVTPFRCTAKVRYRQYDQPCMIHDIDDQGWHITFAPPVWAATPGQSVVFYSGDVCLGGGVIASTLGLE